MHLLCQSNGLGFTRIESGFQNGYHLAVGRAATLDPVTAAHRFSSRTTTAINHQFMPHRHRHINPPVKTLEQGQPSYTAQGNQGDASATTIMRINAVVKAFPRLSPSAPHLRRWISGAALAKEQNRPSPSRQTLPHDRAKACAVRKDGSPSQDATRPKSFQPHSRHRQAIEN